MGWVTIPPPNQPSKHSLKYCIVCDTQCNVPPEHRTNYSVVVCEGACAELVHLNPLPYEEYYNLNHLVVCQRPNILSRQYIAAKDVEYTYTTTTNSASNLITLKGTLINK